MEECFPKSQPVAASHLDDPMTFPNSPSSIFSYEERRGKPRTYEPFPAKVRGMDAAGTAFEIDTRLDNLSAGGLYVRLSRQVEPGAKLSMVFQISMGSMETSEGLRVAADGIVARSEPQPDGAFGLGVAFTRFRYK